MNDLGNPESLTEHHRLSTFNCGESALDLWLVRHALTNQRSGQTKTFVLPLISNKRVIAFYSLVAATITHEGAIPGLLKATPRSQPVPAILLARLAVTQEYQGRGIGRALLKDALKRSLRVSEQIGVRAVLVHAKNPEVAEYYRAAAGFESSPTDPLHLMLPIQDITAALD